MLLSSCINTFQTDEFYNTESYTLSFPLSRKQIVLSKFVFTLIMLVISSYIGLVIYFLIHLIINPGEKGLNLDMLKMFFMLELSALVVDSVFYPVIYKFGCEKSRLVMMSIVMLLLGVASILSVSINVFHADVNLAGAMNFVQTYGVYVLTGLVILFLIGSYFLSIKFYKRKDY
jgi:ABC-type transport system involved in multi-copper enzyme maturation permease subunit